MKTIEKMNGSQALDVALGKSNNSDGLSSRGDEFAGMYQAGFESGYNDGRKAGYQQGFREGYAAAHQVPGNGAAMTVVGAKTAPKDGPRRMLVGMPCERCRVYLHAGETHCPCCKQACKA